MLPALITVAGRLPPDGNKTLRGATRPKLNHRVWAPNNSTSLAFQR